VSASPQLLLALDYGGTKHAAALLRVGERAWAAHTRVQSPSGPDAAYDQATMLRMARGLLTQVPGRLIAIGVSFGGPVDAARGLVRLSHHVPGWEEIPLAEQLRAEFGAPAAVDNDANVAALGEWRFGAGQGCESLLYVTVSTGIGGGWVLGGRIWGGADGMAGEIGHMIVRPGGTLCDCGRRGCLEAEACGRAIAAKARARLLDEGQPSAQPPRGTDDEGAKMLAAAGGRVEAVTAQIVAQAAEAGDALAQAILDDAARMLGLGLSAAISLLNPERVVLGGGVTKSGARWWRTVRAEARATAFAQSRVDIVPAALGDDAPLWGAIALAETLIREC
jgi:glucokinase